MNPNDTNPQVPPDQSIPPLDQVPQAEQPSYTSPSAYDAEPGVPAQPFVPQQPVEQPIVATPALDTNQYPQLPQDDRKKRLKTGLIIGGAILLTAVIALFVYFMFFTVSKDDYRQAREKLDAVKDTVSVRPSINSSGDPADARKSFQESLDKYKAANKQLVGLKAFRADSELREKYDAYSKKAEGMITLLDNFAPSLEKFLTSTQALREISSSSTATDYRDAQKVVDNNKDAADPSIKTYLEKLSKTLGEMAALRERAETATSSTDRLAISRDMIQQSRELTTAARTLRDDLNKRSDDVNPRDAFNALGEATTAKANK